MRHDGERVRARRNQRRQWSSDAGKEKCGLTLDSLTQRRGGRANRGYGGALGGSNRAETRRRRDASSAWPRWRWRRPQSASACTVKKRKWKWSELVASSISIRPAHGVVRPIRARGGHAVAVLCRWSAMTGRSERPSGLMKPTDRRYLVVINF